MMDQNHHQTNWPHQGPQNPHSWDSLHYNVHGNEEQCFEFHLFHVIRSTLVE